MGKIEIVQVLRGLAAFFVMVYHLKTVLPPEHWAKKGMDLVFNSGPAGVDLFFVISGFLMVLIAPRDTGARLQQSKRFLIRRLIRIWPAYFLVTIGYYVTINALNYYPESVARILKSLLFLPLVSEDPPFLGHAFLLVGWSLNYEMYFYLVIAALLPLGRFRWPVFLVVMAIVLIVIPSVFTRFSLDPLRPELFPYTYLNLITNPIVWNFVFGVLTGILFTTAKSRMLLENVFRSSYLTGVVVSASIGLVLTGYFGQHGPTEWGAAMTVVFIALLFFSTSRQASYPRSLVYLGDISYSVYLLHLPVLVASGTVFRRIGITEVEPLMMIIFTSALTLLLSHFSFQLIERRIGDQLRYRFATVGK